MTEEEEWEEAHSTLSEAARLPLEQMIKSVWWQWPIEYIHRRGGDMNSSWLTRRWSPWNGKQRSISEKHYQLLNYNFGNRNWDLFQFIYQLEQF